MRFTQNALTVVATPLLLVLLSGCAYMKNGSLDDLISDPGTTQHDPQPLQSLPGIDFDSVTENVAEELDESGQLIDLAVEQASGQFPLQELNSEEAFYPAQFPEDAIESNPDALSPLENALPIHDPDDVTPIILKAINKNNTSTESVTETDFPLQNLPVVQNPDFDVEVPTLEIVDPDLPILVARPNPEPLPLPNQQLNELPVETTFPDLEPLRTSPENENRLLPVPVDQNPEESHIDQNDFPFADVDEFGPPEPPADFDMEQLPRELPRELLHEEPLVGANQNDANQQLTPLAFPPRPIPTPVEDETVIVGQLEIPSQTAVLQSRTNADPLTMQQNGYFNPTRQSEAVNEQSDDNEDLPNEQYSDSTDHHSEADNFFVGNRIESVEQTSDQPSFETQSAELPTDSTVAVENPEADLVTAPTTPIPAADSISWQGQLDQTIDVFEQSAEATDDDLEAENLETGLTLLKALKQKMSLQDNSPEEIRQYWTHQIQAINNLLSDRSRSSDSTVAAAALEQLRLAVHHLQVVADLDIFNAQICKSVSGYGQYTPFANNEFVPRQTVLVYCEIDNFAPLLETVNEETTYQTRLSSSFTVRNSIGTVVQHLSLIHI